jgi:hypothetical protein
MLLPAAGMVKWKMPRAGQPSSRAPMLFCRAQNPADTSLARSEQSRFRLEKRRASPPKSIVNQSVISFLPHA